MVWHVSTVARKGQPKRWLNRAKSTPGGKSGNTEMTPRWKQTNQQRLGEDEIHGGENKNRDRRREAKRDTWGEKKKTGKNQSMTVFASNIQPFNWVIDLMRWTSWMRKVKTFPRRDPNCTTKKDVIETQELKMKVFWWIWVHELFLGLQYFCSVMRQPDRIKDQDRVGATIMSVSRNQSLLPLCPRQPAICLWALLDFFVFGVTKVGLQNQRNFKVVIPRPRRISGAQPAILTWFVSNMKMDVMVMYYITWEGRIIQCRDISAVSLRQWRHLNLSLTLPEIYHHLNEQH